VVADERVDESTPLLDDLIVGADIGGTKLSTVLIDSAGRALDRSWVEHSGADYESIVALLEEAVVRYQAEVPDGRRVAALGVAVAGWLSAARDRIVWGANIGAHDEPIRGRLEADLDLPVTVDNDGNAAARAEFAAAGAGRRSMILFALGTGVGGGVMMEGRLLVGGFGLAGELGHIQVDDDGERCVCGGRGCLELRASGRGVARAAGRATSHAVVAAARVGDDRALGVLAAAGRAVGTAVRRLLPVVDPELVVLGGSLAHAAPDFLLPAVHEVLDDSRPLFDVRPAPIIELGRLGPEAGALGAALLARDGLLTPPAPPARKEPQSL
jgi:glucokinase